VSHWDLNTGSMGSVCVCSSHFGKFNMAKADLNQECILVNFIFASVMMFLIKRTPAANIN